MDKDIFSCVDFKSKRLDTLSVFSPKMSEHRNSWWNPSVEFIKFFNLVGRIKPGFYFHRRHTYCYNGRICEELNHCSWAYYCIYVTVEENFLKFEHLQLSFLLHDSRYDHYFPEYIDETPNAMYPMKQSFSSVTKFLEKFASAYERYDNVDSVLCCSHSSSDRVFLVNRKVGEIMWTDRVIYRLNDLTYFPEPYSMNCERDEIITVFDHLEKKIYKLDRRNERNVYDRVGEEEKVSVKSLVESVMSDDGRKIKTNMCSLELEIRLLEKNEGVFVSGYDKDFCSWIGMDLLKHAIINFFDEKYV